MAVMNRLSPLIVRRTEAFATPRAAAQAARWEQVSALDRAEPAKRLEDLKLFATGWIGGLIFFGTYLG
jgi:hypothetical protein